MTAQPYTIRIFVAQGDPDGVRIIDRMNWTGLGLIFPRDKWPEIRSRREFDRAGVYVLLGPDEAVEDKPRVYVGEGDGVRERIDSHFQKKPFWDRAVVFVSSHASGLNKAHVQWLEHALVDLLDRAGRAVRDNGNTPQAPALGEHEVADVKGFLAEILKILPLVEVRVFEPPKPIVAQPAAPVVSLAKPPAKAPQPDPQLLDTIVVPAKPDGFQEVFLGENCWYAIRVSGAMLDRIRYIAAYQSQPISAITHVAEVRHIEPYGDGSKYKVVFAAPAKQITPIPYADATPGSMQGPRYTSYTRILAAKKVSDLF